jgi:predicted AlkP superfamily phosphohydrolase/phosphomutase
MFLGYIDPGTGFTFLTGVGGAVIGFFATILATVFVFFKDRIKRVFKLFIGLFRYKIFILIALILLIVLPIWIIKKITVTNAGITNMKKVIILGMDGLDPKLINNFMEEGMLPNFSKLKENGSSRALRTTNPSQSPVVWSSIATGQNPGKHGLFDFIRRDPKNYHLSLSLTEIKKNRPQSVRKGTPFWIYTSGKKIPTTVIGCPVTFPPDKIYGRMLSGMGVPDILGTQGTFSFYTTEPLKDKKDIGGNVIKVNKAAVMHLEIPGPHKKTGKGERTQVKVPFTVSLLDKNKIKISCSKNDFILKTGSWSEWQSIAFPMGAFRKIKGIARFYLVEAFPEFKLYLSPVNLDPRNPFFPISYPKNYCKELSRKIGPFYTQGMPCDTWAVNEHRLGEEPFIEQVNEVLREKEAIFNLELNRFERGVLFSYFETPDIVQHMFWRYIDPRHPLYEKNAPAEYKNMIKTWYQRMDAVLGLAMQNTGRDDLLMVISDHGFNTFRRAAHVNTWLRQNGYLQLKGEKTAAGGELLEDIDWARTKAYALGFGAIYINQRGREGKGIVSPGGETERLKNEIKDKIKNWIDEKYNLPVINSVYNREDIFWGPYIQETPDLYLGFNTGYRASWQTALGAVPETLLEDNLKKWSGDHLFDPGLIPGILFINRDIQEKNPSVYDIVPTVLKSLGFGPEHLKELKFDGRPLF